METLTDFIELPIEIENSRLRKLGLDDASSKKVNVLIRYTSIESAYPTTIEETEEPTTSITTKSGDRFLIFLSYEQFLNKLKKHGIL